MANKNKNKNKNKKSVPHDPETIHTLTVYMDGAGRRVNEFVQVFGENKAPNFYKGEAVIVIKHPDPAIPEDHVRLEFLFEDATTIQEAFAQFDEVAAAERDLWVKEQGKAAKEAQKAGQNKVIPVGGARGGKLIGLDGKPII